MRPIQRISEFVIYARTISKVQAVKWNMTQRFARIRLRGLTFLMTFLLLSTYYLRNNDPCHFKLDVIVYTISTVGEHALSLRKCGWDYIRNERQIVSTILSTAACCFFNKPFPSNDWVTNLDVKWSINQIYIFLNSSVGRWQISWHIIRSTKESS